MKKLFIFYLLMIASQIGWSQNQTLNQKWNNMLENAETYQHYKVIKKVELAEVQKAVTDTVTALEAEIKQEAAQIKEQKGQIASLQQEIDQLKLKIETLSNAKDNMTFMGNSVDKYSYAHTLWFFVFLILAACAVLFFFFRRSNHIAVQKVNDYEDLFSRFEEYKKNKIETERKLKRELQTQLNLLEEFKRK